METSLIWLTLRLLLMIGMAYFVRRPFIPSDSQGSSVARAAVLPNLIAFVLLLGLVSIIKFFASVGASLAHFATTFTIIAIAQAFWVAYDWMRYKELRTNGRWRSRR